MTMSVVAMGGVGILGVAAVTAFSLRRASASLRYSIWLAGLAAALALPVIEGSGVEVRVSVPEALYRAGHIRGDAAQASSAAPGEVAPVGARDPIVAGEPVAARYPAGVRVRQSHAEPAAEAGTAPSEEGAASTYAVQDVPAVAPSEGPSLRAGESRTPRWGTEAPILLIWSFGALALLLVTLVGQIRAFSLTIRDVSPAPADLCRLLRRAMIRLAIQREVRLVVSGCVRVPATWGVVRPTVILPADYARWSSDTLERVLVHELAHVRRRDCLGYLVGELARALHWFNPLAWLAVHRLRAESEYASDDLVVDLVDRPSAYADDLVTMVRALGGGRRMPRAAVAVARRSGMSARVGAILDPTRSRGPVGRGLASIIGLFALLLAVSATVVTPVVTAGQPEATEGRLDAAVAQFDDQAELDCTAGELDGTAAELGPTAEHVESTTGDVEGKNHASVRGSEGFEPAVSTTGSLPQEYRCVFGQDRRRSMSTHFDDHEVRIRWETDDCRVEIDMEGEVRFSADDRRVVSLAPGALFEVEERLGRDRRRARIESGSDGGMERRFWVDGDEMPWGEASDQWLAQLLPEIFRHSTINAEARVRRMVEEGGPGRVFAEVAEIRSDHVARRYLEILMDVADLTEDDYGRVIEAAAAIESDHGSATLLLAVVDREGLRPAFQDPLLEASEGLDSDHQRTRVLEALLRSQLSPDQLDAVLRSASSIESDHNLSQLLSTIARDGRLSDASRGSFLQALRSIESDHSSAVVINAFLDAGPLDDDELAQVLEMTQDVESDHQLGELLQRVAREYPLSGAQMTIYLRSAARIESDHQTAETAIAVIDRGDFDSEQLELVLRMTERVESDHQRGRILQTLVRRRTLGPAGLSDLLGVAAGIESDHQLASTLEAILDETELDGPTLEVLLETMRHVESSHQRVRLLLEVAERHVLDGAARTLYVALADDLGRRDRDRAMEALER